MRLIITKMLILIKFLPKVAIFQKPFRNLSIINFMLNFTQKSKDKFW